MAKAPLLAATLALPLIGCATVERYVGIGAYHPPPSPTGAFDGSYFGRAHLVRAARPEACPQDRTGVIEVGDKRLSFTYAPLIIFDPTVQPDGSMHDRIGDAALDGRIEGDTLSMTVRTPECETRYRAHSIGNRS